MNTQKKKFDRALCIKAAKQIVDWLMPQTERIILAGSLRRRKLRCGDIEILYIPTFREERLDLLTTGPVNQTDKMLQTLIDAKIIAKRQNVNGSEVWGEKNKLGVHVASGIPVDFFATTIESWHNYLVCRTGGARNNTLIAEAYQRKGRKWHPYSVGYSDKTGTEHPNTSETAVYENAGLRYLQPWDRP